MGEGRTGGFARVRPFGRAEGDPHRVSLPVDFPPAQRVSAGGIELSVHAAGPEDGPAVVLLHGWPELAYSWNRQIAPLANLGFRVLAPDGRGYGASDAPDGVDAYRMDALVSDIDAVLDWAGKDKAVIVGHDWGGIVGWHYAMLRPERLLGVVGVNTPHLPPGDVPPTEAFRAYGGDDHYIVRFQEPGLAEATFGRDLDAFFKFIFTGPPKGTTLDALPVSVTHLLRRFDAFDSDTARDVVVGDADRAVFAEIYARAGLTGGINWYRNFDANWRRMEGVDQVVRVPCLMVSAELDFMLPPNLTRWMDVLTPDLEKHVIPGIGHWTQWEAPDELNRLLCDWLERRFMRA